MEGKSAFPSGGAASIRESGLADGVVISSASTISSRRRLHHGETFRRSASAALVILSLRVFDREIVNVALSAPRLMFFFMGLRLACFVRQHKFFDYYAIPLLPYCVRQRKSKSDERRRTYQFDTAPAY